MSRRVSSRDDLFLSATDMYTLLSFVFIVFAIVQTRSASGEIGTVDLPNVARGVGPPPQGISLAIRWDDGSIAPPDLSRPCGVIVRTAPPDLRNILRSNEPAPCGPRSFGGSVSQSDSASLVRWKEAAESLEESKRNVIIECPVQSKNIQNADAALLACSRLQWVMIDAGFRPLAAVIRDRGGS